MARFKVVDMSPRLLPVVLEQQLVPGTFEYALHALIDSEFDLSALAAKFKNDATAAPAYDPAVMLKIVLLAYSRGVVSSRAIERVTLRQTPPITRCSSLQSNWKASPSSNFSGTKALTSASPPFSRQRRTNSVTRL